MAAKNWRRTLPAWLLLVVLAPAALAAGCGGPSYYYGYPYSYYSGPPPGYSGQPGYYYYGPDGTWRYYGPAPPPPAPPG